MRRRLLSGLILVHTLATFSASAASEIDLRGVWHPETYILNDGSRHVIDGLVFFSETEWSFVVFVVENGEARRGEGEAGRYEVRGDEVVFTHHYLLLAGEAVGSLPETPLRMEIRGDADATRTPCRVTLVDDVLTIRFGPSGNAMTFRRESRP